MPFASRPSLWLRLAWRSESPAVETPMKVILVVPSGRNAEYDEDDHENHSDRPWPHRG